MLEHVATVLAILTSVVSILGFFGGGFWFVVTMRRHIDVMNVRQTRLEADITQMTAETQLEVRKLAEVVIMQSRHDERITTLTMTVVNQGKRLDDTVRRMNTFLDMRAVNVIEEQER